MFLPLSIIYVRWECKRKQWRTGYQSSLLFEKSREYGKMNEINSLKVEKREIKIRAE